MYTMAEQKKHDENTRPFCDFTFEYDQNEDKATSYGLPRLVVY